MAIASGTVWEINSGATASNANAGGFNPANANFLTDFTATSATGNAPVISSASYNFVAGDVGAWIYVKSGTNWTPGYYQITSVGGNAATVNATIGAAIQFSGTVWKANTVAGVATVASPTGGTCGIDFSQGTASIISGTDLACADGDAAAPVITSAGTPFSVRYIGNLIYVSAGTGYTVGRYEIVSVSGSNATLDRAVGTDGAKVDGTFAVGGALSLASSDDAVFETMVAGNIAHVKNGTYVIGGTVSLSTAGSATLSITLQGYATLRGDDPRTTSRPTFNCAAATFTFASQWYVKNIIFVGTASPVVTQGNYNAMLYCKVINSSTTANRAAIICGSNANYFFNEFCSYRGLGMQAAGSNFIYGNYIHDSVTGIYNSTTAFLTAINNLIVGCTSYGIWTDAPGIITQTYIGNTVYGYATPIALSRGFRIDTGTRDIQCFNNIVSGWTTGIWHEDVGQSVLIENYNCLYGNTANTENHTLGANTITTDPGFASVTNLAGTTATTSGSVLTQAAGDFSTVVDGQDYLYLISGTGVTAGIYGITAHTATTLTLDIAPGTNATADKVWRVITGRNFAIGTNAKNAGAPTVFTNAPTNTYVDLGAAQSQYGSGIAANLAGGAGGSKGLGKKGFN